MDISENTTPLIKTLTGNPTFPPPFWFMRQAGRYLPEYQKLRKQAGSFLNLCYNPQLASQVTLQPLQRFPLDAAILFADILLICQALGQSLTFKTGEGPCLTPYTPDTPLTNKALLQTLAPIMETIALTRAKLPKTTALIGFAGAPWTLATYMIKGGSNGMEQTLHFAHHHRPAYLSLQKLLEESTITYLS
ncbi:MAG: uroporphyrinogen decarboxylase family protein, partial [Parvibaculales bacterium]